MPRKRTINATPSVETPEQHADVQNTINQMGAAGDFMPGPTQTDNSNVGNTIARSDEAEKAVVGDQIFEEMYRKSTVRGKDYLKRASVGSGRTALVPPNCEIHPRLGLWGLRYSGKWMIVRWIGTYPRNRQKRHEQGWQYFEGTEWCKRLGLNPEAYVNERGRISTGDVELAWVSDDYAIERFKISQDTQKEKMAEVREKLMSVSGPKVELLEGEDSAVLGELHDRRRFAEARS